MCVCVCVIHVKLSVHYFDSNFITKDADILFSLQILIGKTGKTSLKRRVSECNVSSIPRAVAQRVITILSRYEFTNVQDTSLGCAVFYSWVSWCLVMVVYRNCSYV